MPNYNDPKPWEQQLGESSKAFSTFCVYRDMQPHERSMRQVSHKLECTPRNIEIYASRNRWQDRVRAFDTYIDRIHRRERLAAEAQMVKRHADIASRMQELVAQKLSELTLEDLSVTDCARLFQVSAKLEREARRMHVRDVLAEAEVSDEEVFDDGLARIEAAMGKKIRSPSTPSTPPPSPPPSAPAADAPASYPANIDSLIDEECDSDADDDADEDAASQGAPRTQDDG